MPRDGRNQRVLDYKLSIDPAAGGDFQPQGLFRQRRNLFLIHEPHRSLTISAASLIEMEPGDLLEPCLTPAWEEARVRNGATPMATPLDAYQFVFPSPRIAPAPEFAAYAEPSFTAGRPFLEAAVDLCHRIYTDFHYDQQATTVATSVAEVLQCKRGRLSGFRAFRDCVPAVTGPGGAICERLPENRRIDRQPGVARLGIGVFPGSGLVRSGSYQRSDG